MRCKKILSAVLIVILIFGTLTASFTVSAAGVDVSGATVNNFVQTFFYAGFEIEQTNMKLSYSGEELKEGTDYTLEYSDNLNVGEASVVITGIGNFSGIRTIIYKIIPRSIETFSFTEINDMTYTGNEITLAVSKVHCKTTKPGGEEYEYYIYNGIDFSFSYEDNIDVGEADVIIKGIGNFDGVKTLHFNIVPADITAAVVSEIAEQKYSGSEIKPTVSAEFNGKVLLENSDYVLEYKENINVGNAKVLIKGKGNFTGTKTVSFTIDGKIGVTGVEMSSEKSVRYNDNFSLTASVKPDTASDKTVTWKSSNPRVATVDTKGNVTTNRRGTAVITATTADGSYKAECNVTVYYTWWQWVLIIPLFGWIWYLK